MTDQDYEVIVVGGGPAGSAVSAELASAGHRVLLLDKARFPRHKACSEYINPAAVQILDQMGMTSEINRAGAHRMEAMLVHAPGGKRFVADFARAEPGRAALGLSRFKLDHLLLERARSAGVTICEQAHVRSLIRANNRVTGVDVTIHRTHEQIRAPLVIGADGVHSVVARDLGLSIGLRWPRKTGLVAHYRGVADLNQFGELHVGNHSYVGLAPLEDGLTNVAVVANTHSVAARSCSVDEYFSAILAEIPSVAHKMARAEPVGTIRGVGSMAHRARRTVGNGFMLIGDAASFLDPFTGEGIYEALRGAQLAAPVASAALRSGDTSTSALDPYRLARRRTFTAKRDVCWIVQGFVNSPLLMNYVTDRLDRREELGLTLAGVLGNFRPATQALSPLFLARLLRP